MQAMEISRTALDVEWRRLEIISENLANMNSVRADGSGHLYREKNLVSGPRADFETHLADGAADTRNLGGVAIYGIDESTAPPRLAHEPGNPRADEQGMVAYPNIDHAKQMLEMVKTSRAYEANIVAITSAREMYSKALELGRRP